MADTSNRPVEPAEVTARRREQDLECLTLFEEMHQLRMKSEFLDDMFAALKGGSMVVLPVDSEDPATTLKDIDRELDF